MAGRFFSLRSAFDRSLSLFIGAATGLFPFFQFQTSPSDSSVEYRSSWESACIFSFSLGEQRVNEAPNKCIILRAFFFIISCPHTTVPEATEGRGRAVHWARFFQSRKTRRAERDGGVISFGPSDTTELNYRIDRRGKRSEARCKHAFFMARVTRPLALLVFAQRLNEHGTAYGRERRGKRARGPPLPPSLHRLPDPRRPKDYPLLSTTRSG